MIPTRPKGPIQAGRRIPKTRSREYLSGSRIMSAVETAMLSTGSSAPPSVTQIGLPLYPIDECGHVSSVERPDVFLDALHAAIAEM